MQPYRQETLFHFTYNLDTKVVVQDDSLVETYGLQKVYEDMPHSFVEAVVFEDDREKYTDIYRRIEQGERFATCDFRVKGSELWSRVSLYRDSMDSPVVEGFVQDVSEFYAYVIAQAEERDKEKRLRIGIEMEAIQLMRGITDTYDMMISVNLSENYYHMLSYDRFLNKTADDEGVFDDLIEVGISTIPDSHKESFRNAFARENLLKAYAKGDKDVYLEHQQYDEKGELHWVSTHVLFTENPYNDDVLEITLSRNIDERIRKEAESKAILQDALLMAEKASKAKSEFLSRMSHDIRTPMNAVIGYATIAATHIDEKERVKDSLKKILSSGEHLQGLINDVLDMSRIEAGKESLNLARISISEMIRTVLPMIQAQISTKQIELYVDTIDVTNEFVYADAQKIRQLLLNILGNAVKFTSNGGKISVKIKQMPSRQVGHAVYTFLIRDTGIGMSKEFQEHLFETFSQERTSTNSKQLGTGLGMAIAKNYVDMMGGTISVESEIGKGTEFAVKLEFKLQEDVKPDIRLEQLRGYRALVVDDDFQSCESVVHLLRDIGMRADEPRPEKRLFSVHRWHMEKGTVISPISLTGLCRI